MSVPDHSAERSAEFARIFGKDQSHMYGMLRSLADYADHRTYRFMDLDKFHALVKAEPANSHQVYWSELLGRAHFAAATSAIRHARWLDGALDASRSGNFLAFCASFRGLLESTADSYEALARIPRYIASHGRILTLILRGHDFGKNVFIAPEVEQSLIHFSHARAKLDLDKDSDDAHRAKTIRAYLTALEVGRIQQIHDCYSELCETCHPAVLSVLSFVNSREENDSTIWTTDTSVDRSRIDNFLSRYQPLVRELSMFIVNPILLTFFSLNLLSRDELYCPLLEKIGLDRVPELHKIKNAFQDSAGEVDKLRKNST